MKSTQPPKREPPRVPSPAPSNITCVTTLLRPLARSPANEMPSTSSAGHERRVAPPAPRITIRPLAELIDPDDRMSMVSMSTQEVAFPSSIETPTEIAETQTDWRWGCRSVVDRLKHILVTQNMYQDVIFEVQGEKTKEQFPAHKLILRISSRIFNEMFEKTDTGNGNQNQVATISSSQSVTVLPITDVDPFIFGLLLKYIYTDQCDKKSLNEYQLVDLLEVSLKYDVNQLYLDCVNELKTVISDKVVIRLCEIAASYCDKDLLEICMASIARDATTVLSTEDFTNISKQNLIRLVERDDLNIDEISLFEAAIRWAEFHCMIEGKEINQSSLREILSDILPKIRFPLMNPEEFALKVVPSSLLTMQEQNEIYPYLCVDKSKLNQLQPISFNTKPRRPAKLLALESDSDYPESAKSNSRQGSVASTAIADNTATEPDSETASTVSSHKSDSRKRLKRQHSTTSKSKRRRKETDAGPSKPSRTVSMDDLFGESEGDASIAFENMTMSFNKFISECRRMKKRKKVESIILDNVEITDYKILVSHKVNFPNLKQFTLNLRIGESIPKTQSDVFWEKFCIKNFLFFTTSDKDWSYSELWSLGVRITVMINKVVLLKLNMDEKNVTLNKFNGAQSILKSLTDQNVKSLVYSYSFLMNEKFFPTSLKTLTILGIKNTNYKCWGEFLQRFRNLKDLTLVCTATAMEKDSMNWRIRETLPFKDKLRKLGLSCTSISLDYSVKFPNVKKLYLWKTTWDQNFETRFHHIFPQLEEAFFMGPMKASHVLLKNLSKIETLSRVISWQCDWSLSSEGGVTISDIIYNCRMPETDKKIDKNFMIQRTEEDAWECSAVSIFQCQEYNYTLFGFSSLYEDIQAYNK